MNRDRPLGVALITGYLLLKSIALILAAGIVYARSDFQPQASDFISNVAFKIGVSLPLPTALLDITVGLGIWFLKKWSRTIIVLTNTYGLCRMAIGSAILMKVDRRFLESHTSSPYFGINLVASILILFYLLHPDVKRIFGEQE